MYQSPGRYASYDYEDETLPHSSHDYYDSSEYPGKRKKSNLESFAC